MIETKWWDGFIIHVSYGDGTFDFRLGVFCLLVIVILAWNLVTAFLNRRSGQ